jgi:hypothetical protein
LQRDDELGQVGLRDPRQEAVEMRREKVRGSQLISPVATSQQKNPACTGPALGWNGELDDSSVPGSLAPGSPVRRAWESSAGVALPAMLSPPFGQDRDRTCVTGHSLLCARTPPGE